MSVSAVALRWPSAALLLLLTLRSSRSFASCCLQVPSDVWRFYARAFKCSSHTDNFFCNVGQEFSPNQISRQGQPEQLVISQSPLVFKIKFAFNIQPKEMARFASSCALLNHSGSSVTAKHNVHCVVLKEILTLI